MTDHPHIDETLHRLLGPAAPETSCDECFARLDAYVDRDVLTGDAAQAMPELAAHLRGCPACAEDYESLRALVRGDGSAGA
jgi:uncharacterized protein YuzB (UPF0349 family)